MSSKPWYRWYPGDYLQDTVHLSLEQDGAYRRMLDWSWANGPIPDSLPAIARIMRVHSQKARCLMGVLRGYFEERSPLDPPPNSKKGGYLISIKLEKGRVADLDKSLKCKEAGRISVEKNRQRNDNLSRASRSRSREEEDKRREEPLSVSSPQAKSTPQNLRFAEWWEAYPKKVGRKPCAAIWKRRGLDSMVDALIDDVRTRASQDAKWLDGFVPNPQTYLNQDRWEDEINTERAKASNGRKTYDDYMQNLGPGVDAGPPGEILGGNVVAVRPKVVR